MNTQLFVSWDSEEEFLKVTPSQKKYSKVVLKALLYEPQIAHTAENQTPLDSVRNKVLLWCIWVVSHALDLQ